MRTRSRTGRFALATLGLVLGLAVPAQALVLPAGFEDETVASGLAQPVNLAWAPDGRMFIAEKPGRVRVVTKTGTLLPTPLIDISDHVNSATERGLLGIAVDTDFATNHLLWLLYDFDHDPSDTTTDDGPQTARLTRITVPDANVVTAPATAETVVLGKEVAPCLPSAGFVPANALDCLPAHAITHTIGTVKSAPDGTLWIGSGDNSTHQDRVPSHEWTQRDDSLSGKILHIDRQGRGLPGHPFCPGETDLTKVCTKLYAKGFRNPYRFTLRPGGLLPIVGDVGWGRYEEVDIVAPGGNYGWPCYEGAPKSPWEFDPFCQPLYAKAGTAGGALPPAWSLSHQARPDPFVPTWQTEGASIIGGPVFASGNYPAPWRNRLIIGDYARGWMAGLDLTGPAAIAPTPVRLATGWELGVDLQLGPDGDLYYVSIFGAGGLAPGVVQRIRYSPDNRSPVPVATATPTSGRRPLAVRFTGSRSSDPDGDPLTYRWDFGDGATSTLADPSHTYTAAGRHTATLTVDDGRGREPQTTVAIAVDDSPPQLTLAAPADGATFRVGDTVALRASFTDAEDATTPGSRIGWQVRLVHRDHVHFVGEMTGTATQFATTTDHDADSWYEITAMATDSGGLTDRATVTIRPRTAPLTITSEPAGAPLTYAETSGPGPLVRTAAPGFATFVSTAPSFVAGGVIQQFRSWSDGGARGHALTMPDGPTTLVARFSPATQGYVAAGAVRFLAAAGQANALTIATSGGGQDVLDAANAVLPGSGCTAAEARKVHCPGALPVRAELGDGDDSASVLSDAGVTIDGGPGHDRITGGPGADVPAGEDGDDVLVTRDGRAEAVDCGAGNDAVTADEDDVLLGCEAADVPLSFSVPGPPFTAGQGVVDRTPPAFVDARALGTVRLDRRGRLLLDLGRPTEALRATIVVAAGTSRRTGTTLARRTLSLRGGTRAKVTLTLTKAGAALVRRRRTVTAVVTITVADRQGNRARRNAALKVRAR